MESIKIQSDKLQKPVWIAEDREAAKDLWKSGVRDTIYLFQEVWAMKDIDEVSLKAVQMVKEVFSDAIVEKINEPGSDVPPCKPLSHTKCESTKAGNNQVYQANFLLT